MQKRKLTDEQVKEIRLLATTTMKKADIARKYGVSPQLISTVLRFDYGQQPRRDRRKAPTDEFTGWEALARDYTLRYPEDAMNGAEAKAIHDMALKKVLKYWTDRNVGINDLI